MWFVGVIAIKQALRVCLILIYIEQKCIYITVRNKPVKRRKCAVRLKAFL